MSAFLKEMFTFQNPKKARAAVLIALFAIAMLAMAHNMEGVGEALMRQFAGTLALFIGSAYLGRGAKAFKNSASNFGLLLLALGLVVLGLGVTDILIVGGTNYAKELAIIVGTGSVQFLTADDDD